MDGFRSLPAHCKTLLTIRSIEQTRSFVEARSEHAAASDTSALKPMSVDEKFGHFARPAFGSLQRTFLPHAVQAARIEIRAYRIPATVLRNIHWLEHSAAEQISARR